MQHVYLATDSQYFNPALISPALYMGGDRSPLNDADADEDPDAEVYLDPDLLGLDDFVDSDKFDSGYSGDIGSSTIN